jgi:hypothetical protein
MGRATRQERIQSAADDELKKIARFQAVLRTDDILVLIRIRIQIRGSMPLTNRYGSGYGSGPNPAIFVIVVQDANKQLI